MAPAAAFAALPSPVSDWDGRLALGPLPEGAVTLEGLATSAEALDEALAAAVAGVDGADAKLACSYLVGRLAWRLGEIFGGAWLDGWCIARAEPGAVALKTRFVAWEATHLPVLDVTLDPAGLERGAADPAALARVFVALFSSLVARLAEHTGHGPAAQWRLVGDGLTGAILHIAKQQGRAAEAVALGRVLVSDPASPLRSRQTEFVELGAPDGTAREWFLLRGGCCRYYTTLGGEYCDTCVLRKRTSQIERLRAGLGPACPPSAPLGGPG